MMLSGGLPVLASDIPANLEIGLAPDHYFSLGDNRELSLKLNAWMSKEHTEAEAADLRKYVACTYNWRSIAKQTFELYRRIVD